MNKIIFRIGWPGALLLLVVCLALGIYAIINKSTIDGEVKEIKVETKKVDQKSIPEDSDTYTKAEQNISNIESTLSNKNTNDRSVNTETKDENKENLESEDLIKNKKADETQSIKLEIENESINKPNTNNEKTNDIKINSSIQNIENLENNTSSNLENKEDGSVKNKETFVDIIRVDEGGNTVIAGTADPSTTVEAKIQDEIVGKTEVSEDGGFVITGQISSSNNPQELKIFTKIDKKVKTDNKNLKEINSDWVYETKSFLILPGTIKQKDYRNVQNEKIKDVTIIEVEKQDFVVKQAYKVVNVDKLTLDRIKYSENGTAILFGRARTELKVLVYLNNKFQTKAIPGADGGWTIDLGFIPPGLYNLRIDEVTKNGDVKFRIETPFKQETKDLLDKMFADAITVQPGNSLWRIARRIYGRGIMYIDIYKRNSHLIKDPNLIYPGQIFSLLD